MVGHENAYKVCWLKKRKIQKKVFYMIAIYYICIIGKGFVHIATQAQVPIIPTFIANQEEMRWNPFLYF